MPQSKGRVISTSEGGLDVLGRSWGWMFALGVLYLVLGVVGLSMLLLLTFVSVLFIGVMMLVGGVAQIAETFKCKGWKGVIWHILIAILYIIGGLAILYDPVLATKVITLVLAAVLLAVGSARMVMALQMRGERGWFWTLVAGAAAIGLGLMIVAKWPISGLFAIGLFVAVDMVMQGWSYITIAFAARRRARTATASAS